MTGYLFILSETKTQRTEKIKQSCMLELELNIIHRVKAGDINAFREIVELYKDKALNLTMKILKNKDDAEDSLQEAFIKAFRSIMEDKFEERSRFSTYLYRIVYNSAIDYYKKHISKSFNLLSIDNNPSSDDENDLEQINFEKYIAKDSIYHRTINKTEVDIMNAELQYIINDFLKHLPEKYSLILTLFYVNDLTHNEISDVLGLPLGTVKNRIFRAKDKLKELILRRYPNQEILEYI